MFYPEDLPYLKTTNKKIYLPVGKPIGKGNVVFLFSKDINQSLNMIDHPMNLKNNNRYKYYYYEYRYNGRVNNKRFMIKNIDRRKEIYDRISKETNVSPFPIRPLSENDKFNMYYDLIDFIDIFYKLTESNTMTTRVIKMFWEFFTPILTNPVFNGFDNKFLMIPVDEKTSFTGSIRNLINNPIFLIYYTLYKDFNLMKNCNIDILFYTNRYVLKFNPSQATDKTYGDFKKQMTIMFRDIPKVNVEKLLSDDKIDKDYKKSEIQSSVTPISTTDDSKSEIITDLNDIKHQETSEENKEEVTKKSVEDKVVKKISKVVDGEDETEVEDDPMASIMKIDEEMNNDKELVEDMYKLIKNKTVPSSPINSERDRKIREEQKNIKIKNTTIGELQKIDSSKVVIPVNDVSNKLKTTNKNLYNVKYTNFDKTYNEQVMPKDIVNAITSLNNKSLPMYVIKVDIKDTSDELNYKDTYTFVLEDTFRQRHTITVDIPKFIDNKFLYIGGNKKLVLKQNFFMPVVKTSEDTVQIVSNYNKMTLRREGTKSLSSLERLAKMLKTSDELKEYFTFGNAYIGNAGKLSTIEYDELSKKITEFNAPNTKIYFSLDDSKKVADSKGFNLEGTTKIFIGYEKAVPILLDTETQKTENGDTIMDIIIRNLPENLQNEYNAIKTPKRLMYNSVTIMDQSITLASLLGYWEGLDTLLNKMKVEYTLEQKLPAELPPSYNAIKFNDCYMVYKDDIPTGLILNGLRILETDKYNIADFNTMEPYMKYFLNRYGKLSIGNALMNAYEFTIDNITLEILQDLDLPEDIVNLMIYGSNLLADSQFLPEINQSLSRVRSTEIIPAILYDAIAKNYITYKNSNGKKKLSIPRDIVIKNVLSLKTVEDYSTLNPVLEMERTNTVSCKGWRGTNLEQAYTIPKRTYDPSMIGIMGLSTSPDGNVGIQRTMTMEPNITSIRGYSNIDNNNYKDLKDVNLFSPGEMMIPMAATRDDAIRMGHAIKQSKHVIPVKNSSPVLISNGAEEVARFYLSSDFVINAKMDGTVVEYDEKLKIMICEYKDGTHQAINLNPRIQKNGGGGFFVSNVMMTNLKVGDKFKKNDMLAWHKDYFTHNTSNGNRLNIGTLTKVALMSTYNTYEDSSFITNKLSHDAATEMCFNKQITLGRNSNVEYIAKVGQHINVGDSLIQFDTSFEDDELNILLNSIGEELSETVLSDSRNDIKSKIAGVIEDIKIYSTVELSELSPSLQKIVGSYYRKINAKKKLLESYDPDSSIIKCGLLFDESTKKIVPNKFGVVKGQKLEDGVLIEFYLKHEEMLEVGSKIAFYTALKSVIGEIIPEGFEPYSELHPDEEVSSIIASNSILARMTPSIILATLGNKVLVELKRKLKTMFTMERKETRRATMTNLIYKLFTAFDKSGTNTKYYKSLFEPMSDAQFTKYFTELFEDDKAYLILNITDYENTIKMEDIERAAKVLNIPLYEKVYLPHITMDKNQVVTTKEPVPVGYVHIKRTQQTVAKKNGISTSADIRSALTGQVTGADKNGRESDLENTMLISLGMKDTLRELNGPRADDMYMKREMLTSIATKGYVSLDELTNDVTNKTTLNTVNVFLLGMSLDSDLVTKGLMVNKTLDEEL